MTANTSLSQICKIILSGTPKTSVPEYWNGDIKWVTPADITKLNDRYIHNTERKITKEGIENSSAKLLKKNTIIISARGTVGELCIIPSEMSCNQSCYALEVFPEIVRPLYLFYILKNLKTLYTQISHGTTFDTITKTTFDEIKINLPSLDEQDKLIPKLDNLDSKIENLQNQNKILEQTAQAIFKSWFVDFDGVTEFEDSELGKIPKGWSVKQIKEILGEKGYIRGPFGSSLKRADLKSEGIPVYEQQHIIRNHRNFRFFIDDEKFKKMSRFTVKENDILISCSGTVGKVTTIKPDDPKGIISQALLILRPDTKLTSPRFLEYFLRSNNGYKAITSSSSGSVQINLARREIIQSITLIHPEKNLLKKFQDIINKIDNSLAHNTAFVISLTKTRDALLPKLMSGEIRV